MIWMNSEEAAEYLNISPYTVRKYFREGKIEAKKKAQKWLTARQWLDEWVKGDKDIESEKEEIDQGAEDEEGSGTPEYPNVPF